MPNLGFDLHDYSTKTRLDRLPGNVEVIVARRDLGFPPLEERSDSSVRLDERRLFFRTTRSPSGHVVITDVAPGTYEVRVRADRYLPVDTIAISPHAEPMRIELHRGRSYPFAPDDTLIRGNVVQSTGEPLTGFDVRLIDPSPSVPSHRVPLDAQGEFVIFVPEKLSSGNVQLEVFNAGPTVLVPVPVNVHRSNVVPTISVP